MKIANAEQMKQIEAYAIEKMFIPVSVLMENAGQAVYDTIVNEIGVVSDKKCVVLCGTGNNGGDGFVVARIFASIGAGVNVIIAGDKQKIKEDALVPYNKLTYIDKCELSDYQSIELIKNADIIVDAIFGTGFQGVMNQELMNMINLINGTKAYKVAADLPSGMNADNGNVVDNCIKADLTVTFGLCKPCHFMHPSSTYCGKVVLNNIGIPKEAINCVHIDLNIIDEAFINSIMPIRNKFSHKGTFGNLLAICGSSNMTGAAFFAAMGALRSGVGLVNLSAPKSIIPILQSKLNEPVFLPYPDLINDKAEIADIYRKPMEKSSACLIGCGIGTNEATDLILEHFLLNFDKPLVLDADALSFLAERKEILKQTKAQLVITPHLKEFSRLCGLSIEEINENKISVVKEFSLKYNVVTVLKGAYTVISMQNGDVYINITGNSGLAKGGSGDVLAGMLSAFLAQGFSLDNAAVSAVYYHGLAADKLAEKTSEYGMSPTDLIGELPFLYNKFNGG
jgi:hydroxyethylthiazole kinase-like uncharacterized protein yjeF